MAAAFGSKAASTLGGSRLDGFRKALDDAGKGLSATQLPKDAPSFHAGHYGAEHILAGSPDLDLLYFLDDIMTIGAMLYRQSRCMDIPNDIAIAGWGGMDITSVLPTG